MGKPPTFSYKSSPIPSYQEGLRSYDADIIKAKTFEEARQIPNFPDRHFFSDLRLMTSEWTARDPDVELRLQISHYLSTANFTYKDFQWIQCPTPYSFRINTPRFKIFHEQLRNLIDYSLFPVDWSSGRLKRAHCDLQHMLKTAAASIPTTERRRRCWSACVPIGSSFSNTAWSSIPRSKCNCRFSTA